MAVLRTVATRTKPRLVIEFSLYHPVRHRWVTVGPDGGVRFDSPDPIPLSRFFAAPDAGTEEFAVRMLEWVRSQQAPKRAAKWVDKPAEAKGGMVFAYERETDEAPDSGIRFRPLRRNAGLWTSFEVRGLPDRVTDWCRYYEECYPHAIFKTRFLGQPSQPGLKVVNIVRLKDEGEGSPPLDVGEDWQPHLRQLA
jgi:hypothetical protein